MKAPINNSMNDEPILYLNFHTHEVRSVLSRRCTGCHTWKAISKYYRNAKRCKPCYERYWVQKADERAREPIEMELERTMKRANRRNRYRRSHGPDLCLDEVTRLWEACRGQCAHCGIPLTFRWMPRHQVENLAILDRIDTSENRSYHGNAQFMCQSCNQEKGGFDLADQLDREIKQLKKRLRRMKRKRRRGILYTDVLYPHVSIE